MIQEKNARWIYQAERELEEEEVRYALMGRTGLFDYTSADSQSTGSGSRDSMPRRKRGEPERQPRQPNRAELLRPDPHDLRRQPLELRRQPLNLVARIFTPVLLGE